MEFKFCSYVVQQSENDIVCLCCDNRKFFWIDGEGKIGCGECFGTGEKIRDVYSKEENEV